MRLCGICAISCACTYTACREVNTISGNRTERVTTGAEDMVTNAMNLCVTHAVLGGFLIFFRVIGGSSPRFPVSTLGS
jgi:hypothetical protein